MLDPYKMVLINSIASLVLLCGILFYSRIYPKRKINLFIILLFLSALVCISIFRKGVYESGDFNIHIYRIMDFYSSLKEGNIFPSWAGKLNATYGYALFIFNYTLPYYGISLFHFLGASFIASMKLYLGLTFFFSGIFMYLWIKELTGNKLAGFISSIFYLFSPYHLIDVHFRATVGESTIFALAPLLFLFITKYFKVKKIIFLIINSLFTALLFLSHALLAGVFICIVGLYSLLINWRNRKIFLPSIASLLGGIIVSIYMWAPFLIYAPYTLQNKLLEDQYLGFYPFHQIFYSPWQYGFLFQGHHGELALIIGYTQLFVLLATAVMMLTKKISKHSRNHVIFWLCLCLFFIFLMHPISAVIWRFFPLLTSLIPTGRLLLVISFCVSVIAGYFVMEIMRLKVKKVYIYILVIITIGSTILNWGHRRVIPTINDQVLLQNVWKSTSEGEGHFYANSKLRDPKNPWFSELPKDHIEILKGSGEIKKLARISTKHIYVIYAKTPLSLKENTLYFPGWKIYDNEKLIDINPDREGVITFNISKGLHYVEVKYDDIFIYKLLKHISMGGFLVLIGYLLIFSCRKLLSRYNQ